MSDPPVIHIFCTANHDHWSPQDKKRALALLPPLMQEQMTGLRRWQDRQARLQGRLLLRAALTGIDLPADLTSWSCSPAGKPRLSQDSAEFSISHTSGMTVCALTLGSPLGVDIEHLQILQHEELSAYFTPAEMVTISVSASPWRALLRLWTAKEAVLKATGSGLLSDPAKLEVLSTCPIFNGITWHLVNVDLGPAYMCHVASLHPQPLVTMRTLTERDLLQESC